MQPQVISDLGIAVLLYRLSRAGIPFISVLKLPLTERAVQWRPRHKSLALRDIRYALVPLHMVNETGMSRK